MTSDLRTLRELEQDFVRKLARERWLGPGKWRETDEAARALVAALDAPATEAPCEVCGRPTGGCCTVAGQHPEKPPLYAGPAAPNTRPLGAEPCPDSWIPAAGIRTQGNLCRTRGPQALPRGDGREGEESRGEAQTVEGYLDRGWTLLS